MCTYFEYSNASLGYCDKCKTYNSLNSALKACCSNIECAGVTFSNAKTGSVWAYEIRITDTLVTSRLDETSYTKSA